MGFHLIFLTPAFFVDVTEAWVYAGRWQRLVTIIAGIWVEMIFALSEPSSGGAPRPEPSRTNSRTRSC